MQLTTRDPSQQVSVQMDHLLPMVSVQHQVGPSQQASVRMDHLLMKEQWYYYRYRASRLLFGWITCYRWSVFNTRRDPSQQASSDGSPANEEQRTITGALSQQASVQMDHLLPMVSVQHQVVPSQQVSVQMDHLLMKEQWTTTRDPASRLLFGWITC